MGLAVRPTSRSGYTAGAPSGFVTNPNSGSREPSSLEKASSKAKIVIGNIGTVPFQELYGLLSNRSPEEMTELARQLENLPASKETKTKIISFFKTWAHFDARAAMSAARSFKSPEASAAIAAVIDGADATTADFIARSIDDLPSEALSRAQKANFLGRVLSKWSELDPVAAAQFLDSSQLRGKGLTTTRITIAENWAMVDPQAALAWAQGQGGVHNARATMSGVIAGWWAKDPTSAEAYVASQINSLGPESAMTLVPRLFDEDPQHAKDWVNQLPNMEARRNANSFIAMQLASEDPKGATEWAASLPVEAREKALAVAVAAWTRQDPTATAQWLQGLNGTSRDEAISAYSSSVSTKDPVSALTWAWSISQDKIRDQSMQRVAAGWFQRSPNDARTWIQSSGLPEAEKTRLLALAAGK